MTPPLPISRGLTRYREQIKNEPAKTDRGISPEDADGFLNSSPQENITGLINQSSTTTSNVSNFFAVISKKRLIQMNRDILQKVITSFSDRVVDKHLTMHNICLDKNNNTLRRIRLLDYLTEDCADSNRVSYDIISEICNKLDRTAVTSHLEFFRLEATGKAAHLKTILKQYLSFASVESNAKLRLKKRKRKSTKPRKDVGDIDDNEDTPENLMTHNSPQDKIQNNKKHKNKAIEKSTNTFDKDPTLNELSTAVKIVERNICDIKDTLYKI